MVSSYDYVPFLSLIIVLIFTRKSLAEGFRKLQIAGLAFLGPQVVFV